MRHASTLVAAVLLAAACCLFTARLLRTLPPADAVPTREQWGLRDFRGNLYYPVVAFLAGENPYDAEHFKRAHDADAFPPFAPIVLAWHLPFGLFPFAVARILYLGL